jgi:hypothetical protein
MSPITTLVARPLAFTLLTLLPLVGSGCAAVESGTLEVGWSLDGKATEARCEEYDAETVVVSVSDSSDTVYASEEFSCTEFTGTIDTLGVGDYEVVAQLFDDGGDAVSSEVGPKDVTIEANETTSIVLSFDEEALSGSGSGTVQVQWTIEGSDDSDQCALYGASYVQVALYDEDGDLYQDVSEADCSDFKTKLKELPNGSYFVAVQLVTASGSGVTEILGPDSVNVVSDTTSVVEFDFSQN